MEDCQLCKFCELYLIKSALIDQANRYLVGAIIDFSRIPSEATNLEFHSPLHRMCKRNSTRRITLKINSLGSIPCAVPLKETVSESVDPDDGEPNVADILPILTQCAALETMSPLMGLYFDNHSCFISVIPTGRDKVVE